MTPRFRQSRSRRTVVRLCATAMLVAALGQMTQARADAVEDFYRGKRITIVTSASVGGGYDQYARLLARFLPKHIPGNPAITVQNMPGAEGVKAANYLYNVAARDGTIIGGLQRNTGLVKFYNPASQTAQYDARKFDWLGSPQQETGLFIINAKSGVKTVADLKNKDITVSSTAHTAPTTIYPLMLNALYGTKIKVVEGYDGSQACLLAVERGEVDGHVSGGSSAAWRARIDPWLKNGSAHIILQQGIQRDPAYPDVPTAIDIMDTPDTKKMFEIAFAEQVMGRPFVLPPGLPADRVKALRNAFDATMKDPELIEAAAREHVEIDPVSGAQINALLDRVFSAPPELAERIRAMAK